MRLNKHEKDAKERTIQSFADFLGCRNVITLLQSPGGELAAMEPDAVGILLVEAHNYGLENLTYDALISKILREGGRIGKEDAEIAAAVDKFQKQRDLLRTFATHAEKRTWALKVGLFVPHDERPPFHQWLDRTGIKVVVRPPSTEGLPARRTVLYEYEPLSDPETPYIVVDEAHGFYIVTEEESVCFVYEHTMKNGDIVLRPLLIIVRNFGRVSEETNVPAVQFYTFMDAVIETACNGERRGVRPSEPGLMAQFGYNAGPRHARVWGLAKSFSKKLPQDVKEQRDRDAVAVLSMVWAMIRTHMPREGVDALEDVLDATGMPRMSTRNIEEGDGYEFEIDGQTFSFPVASRAPPEGYLIQAYSARSHYDGIDDDVPNAWSLHSSVCDIIPSEAATPSATSAAEPAFRISTRSQRRRLQELGSQQKSPNPPAPIVSRPLCYGGSFVDLELRVVVRPAPATGTQFDPRRMHGSTRLVNRITRACAFTSSTFIRQAFEKAQAGYGVMRAQKGTGANTE
ncbi:uncharacterized protein STEHIDRAFT_135630 [Stereum hirsutum FP-91666 SS1]|uniref:Uncharacterized protein n=1 Tax=Stereum hirsutum (strain FP-91666) TaxID=721885 RepID=R7RWF2_STEHR|nr:uncharacterized protein STEHIDRAFT_135630 [Stereum hirsutum FP-91666 SS1]EIM79634.1 hypothetical protein STEHIDRAFT_135630 [Stereum hirsutum FP-91666 SS1]